MDFKMIIKKLFRNKLTRRIHQKYVAYKRQKGIEYFHQHGLAVLKDFDEAMTNAGYPYSLAFGSLLGAIRERSFIPHDDDIDTAMWIEDWSPRMQVVLQEAGFKLTHVFDIDGKRLGYEETYVKDGVVVDIFFFYKDVVGDSYYCDFRTLKGASSFADSMRKYGKVQARKLYVPLSKDICRIPFMGISVNIPENYAAFLTARYGEDYMTPMASWSW